LIYRLVLENLKHRPVRTFLSALAIGVQVTMILTLVGVSRGMLADLAQRSRGTGADIVVRPPDSSILGSSGNMPEKITSIITGLPHVALATGVLVQPVGPLETITGIHPAEFNAMSGGFQYLNGGSFQGPDDVVVDDIYQKQHHIRVGEVISIGHMWRVSGIVESGKLSRVFSEIVPLQELYSATGQVSAIYVKADDPTNIPGLMKALTARLPSYSIHTMEEYTSLFSVDNIPLIKPFIGVVVGVAVIVGFLVVFLSMYTAVLERTREIGILKALGASPGYILSILLRETTLLAIAGTIAGILMTYGTRWLMAEFVPNMPQAIVPDWWPIAGVIALVGSLVGAAYPGLKAARQDAIQALAYD
jgi:putative ABC transport system permease protein